MKNSFVILVLLIFTFLSFAPYYSTIWSASALCNNYQYWTSNCTGTSIWVLCKDNGSTCNSGSGNYLCRSTGITVSSVKFINSGWTFLDTVSWCSGIDTTGETSYIVECQDTYYSEPITPPFFQGCFPPTITINKSYVNTTRYDFTFTLEHTVEWSGIYCLLNITSGTTWSYKTIFSSIPTYINLPFSSYPRGFVTGNLVCYYTDQNNQSHSFCPDSGCSWLIDDNEQYMIKDISYYPNPLGTTQNLSEIFFLVSSQSTGSDYGKSIRTVLSSTENLASKGCTGSINGSWNLNYNTPAIPNSYSSYVLPLSIQCIQPANLTINISVYSMADNSLIDDASFNVEWETANIVIDNINLIKNMDSNNLELYATLSYDYTKAPITDDILCSYNLTYPINSTSYSGDMELVNTFGENSQITQSDMVNTTIDVDTALNYGDLLNVKINCSLGNYTIRSIDTQRWIGYVRLKTFKCTTNPTVTFSSKYITENTGTDCIIRVDTALNKSNPTALSVYNWIIANYTSLSIVSFYGNTNADIFSSCRYITVGNYDNSKSYPTYYEMEVFNAYKFSRTNQICQFQPLSEGKVSKDLVYFETSAVYEYITTTSADLTFNLEEILPSNASKTILKIGNNKTTNKGIVEYNDTIVCSTSVYDPDGTVNSVIHAFFDADTLQSCYNPNEARRNPINGSYYSYDTILTADKCDFLAPSTSKKQGEIFCSAFIYDMSKMKPDTVDSNHLPYITASTQILPSTNTSLTMNKMWSLLSFTSDMVLDPLKNLLLSDPIKFLLILLLALLFIGGLAVFSRIISPILGGE